MPLASGTSLGPYQIDGPLGAGGMGEVYKARDTRLDRTVAIKVLAEHVAADPDLKQRFEREAKTVAGLSHPHICPVFDVGSQDGVDFLVVEFLEGETLARHLEQGAVPREAALRIAAEIAGALAAAHERGIIHRDVKPANVMLTASGAKLLDSGVAKLRPSGGENGHLLSAVTSRDPFTQQGTLLGTLPYMAPEQARGKPVDKRADIWAFGCVLYEMLTGHATFEGDTVSDTVASVLGQQPRWDALPRLTPDTVSRLLRRCLGKDPHDRLRDIGDVRVDLREAVDAMEDSRIAVLSLDTGDQRVVVEGGVGARYSPSGHLVYSVGTAVYAVRFDLERSEAVGTPDVPETARPASGTDFRDRPFFSPDGTWVAFFQGGALRTVQLDGGLPVTLCEAPLFSVGVWRDDRIVYASQEGIFSVSDDGGVPARLAGPRAPGARVGAIALIEDSREVLVDVVMPTGRAHIEVVDPDTETTERLLDDARLVTHTASGHLLFEREGVVVAAAFDARTRAVGPAVPLLDGYAYDSARMTPQLAVSTSGTLAYVVAPLRASDLEPCRSNSMPLRAGGTTLGPYSVTAKIGDGGMAKCLGPGTRS